MTPTKRSKLTQLCPKPQIWKALHRCLGIPSQSSDARPGIPLALDLPIDISNWLWASAAFPQSAAESLRNCIANNGARCGNARSCPRPCRVHSTSRKMHLVNGKPSPHSMHQAACRASAAKTRGQCCPPHPMARGMHEAYAIMPLASSSAPSSHTQMMTPIKRSKLEVLSIFVA